MRRSAASFCLFACTIGVGFLGGCGSGSSESVQEVVVYTSVDQVFAEPVLAEFEKKTGIKVLAVYDIEANKTTGLANRIIAEGSRPKADVFWNGEFVQTLRLEENDLLAPYTTPVATDFPPNLVDSDSMWTGLTPRLRVFMSNSSFEERPIALDELTELDIPKDQIAISSPLFGTGSFQAAALYSIMGTQDAGRYYQEIIDSGIRVESGNSNVRDLVVSGDITLGLMDNDDACGAVKRGENVRVFLPKETMLIPSTVALIKDGPNPDPGKALIDFLAGPEAEAMLIEAGWSQLPLHPNSPEPCLLLPVPNLIDIKLEEIVDSLEPAHEDLKPRLIQ